MPVQVWMTHNPKCGTSRTVLAMLRDRGHAPQIRDYLNAPLTRDEIAALVKEMGVPAKDLVRWKQAAEAAAAGIGETSTEAALIQAMADHPVLLNRPIVRTAKGVRLCRPGETVQELL